jgi:hypothetical protein
MHDGIYHLLVFWHLRSHITNIGRRWTAYKTFCHWQCQSTGLNTKTTLLFSKIQNWVNYICDVSSSLIGKPLLNGIFKSHVEGQGHSIRSRSQRSTESVFLIQVNYDNVNYQFLNEFHHLLVYMIAAYIRCGESCFHAKVTVGDLNLCISKYICYCSFHF